MKKKFKAFAVLVPSFLSIPTLLVACQKQEDKKQPQTENAQIQSQNTNQTNINNKHQNEDNSNSNELSQINTKDSQSEQKSDEESVVVVEETKNDQQNTQTQDLDQETSKLNPKNESNNQTNIDEENEKTQVSLEEQDTSQELEINQKQESSDEEHSQESQTQNDVANLSDQKENQDIDETQIKPNEKNEQSNPDSQEQLNANDSEKQESQNTNQPITDEEFSNNKEKEQNIDSSTKEDELKESENSQNSDTNSNEDNLNLEEKKDSETEKDNKITQKEEVNDQTDLKENNQDSQKDDFSEQITKENEQNVGSSTKENELKEKESSQDNQQENNSQTQIHSPAEESQQNNNTNSSEDNLSLEENKDGETEKDNKITQKDDFSEEVTNEDKNQNNLESQISTSENEKPLITDSQLDSENQSVSDADEISVQNQENTNINDEQTNKSTEPNDLNAKDGSVSDQSSESDEDSNDKVTQEKDLKTDTKDVSSSSSEEQNQEQNYQTQSDNSSQGSNQNSNNNIQENVISSLKNQKYKEIENKLLAEVKEQKIDWVDRKLRSKLDKYGRQTNPADDIVPEEQKAPEGFDYGSIPLPKKRDEFITSDDLKRMIDFMINSGLAVDYQFGDRRIDSNLAAKAYSEWLREQWKYNIFFSTANVSLQFFMRSRDNYQPFVENQDTTLSQIHSALFATNWVGNTIQKTKMRQYFTEAFELIKPGMSDVEKAFVLYRHTAQWIDYSLSKVLTSIENTIDYHKGVCAHYATLYGMLLAIVGIDSMPVLTGGDKGVEQHIVVYINLQLPGTDKKMFYASDATWAKKFDFSGDNKLTKVPLSTSNQLQMNYDNFLLPTGASFDKPTVATQFHYGMFHGAKYDQLFNAQNENNLIAVSKRHDSRFSETYEPNTPFDVWKNGFMYLYETDKRDPNTPFDKRSSFEYYNGYFYSLRNVGRYDNNKERLNFSSVLSKTQIASNKDIDIDLADIFKDWTILEKVISSSSKKSYATGNNLYPMLASYKNKFIFIGNNSAYKYETSGPNIELYLVEFKKDGTYSDPITVTIPNSVTKKISNYFVRGGKIYYNFENSVENHLLVLDENIQKWFESNSEDEFIVNELLQKTYFYFSQISTFISGNDYDQIPSDEKDNWYNIITLIQNKIQKNQINAEEAKELIDYLNYKMQTTLESTLNKKHILPISLPPKEVIISKSRFDEYGTHIPFTYRNANSSVIFPQTQNVYMDVLVSDEQKGKYEQIATNIDPSLYRLNKDIISSSKWIKVRVKNINDIPENNDQYFESTPFYLNLTSSEAQMHPTLKIYFDREDRTSNYNNKDNKIDSKNVSISLEYNQSLNTKLYFVSASTKKVSQLDLNNVEHLQNLGLPNENNRGIYVLVGEQNFENRTIKHFSDFKYVYSYDDLNEKSRSDLYFELSQILKEYVENN
ncbi:hypothetical protein V2E24_00830 [Mycoplasmopsis ciconiae]|uniref:Uncharacterized protein n=1 Tax=Mycoplasmopsis ciconiae TaxID=561067 RepID=A0ABU7MKQ9_9BACT|nr:hypothetical protein [Mycoplasmopsis ciconiae]